MTRYLSFFKGETFVYLTNHQTAMLAILRAFRFSINLCARLHKINAKIAKLDPHNDQSY